MKPRYALPLLPLLIPGIAAAQTVQQSGNVTAGHLVTWAAPGVVQDGGVSPPSPVYGPYTQQSGSITPGHVATWTATGVIQDGGAAAATMPGGTSLQVQFNNGTTFGGFTMSGDATLNASTGGLTLSTVNSNVGTFTNATVQADGKGRILAISSGSSGGGVTVPNGNSGGIPYYSATTTITSSALLTHYGLVYGGGSAGSPVAMAACGSGVPILGGSPPTCGSDANIAYLDVSGGQAFTTPQRTPQATITSGATLTPNFNSGNDFTVTLIHADCPCTLANPSTTVVAGQAGVLWITQSATGSDSIATLGTDWMEPGSTSGGIPLSSGAGELDACPYKALSSTKILIGACALNASH